MPFASSFLGRTGLVRVLSAAALVLAVVWYVVDQGFEPIITAILGLAGLISTRRDPAEVPFVLSSADQERGPFGDPKSIAVLPLEAIGGQEADEVFADGLTEDLIAHLGKVPDLNVISRTSVMQFKATRSDLRRIASMLRVGSVLEGSVRRSQGRLRVVAKLIDAESDRQMWTESYDRELDDLFQIQSEIALQVAEALQGSLSAESALKLKSIPTTKLDAHDAYLLGRHHWISATAKGFDKAKHYFERAVELDPDHAPAHAGLAYWYVWAGGSAFGGLPPADAIPIAKREAERAIALDPNLGDAYGVLATVESGYYWQWDEAEAAGRLGVEKDPNSYIAWNSYAWVLDILKRSDECVRAIGRFLAISPLEMMSQLNAAWLYCHVGEVDQALIHANQAEQLDEGFFSAACMAYVLECRGEAVQALERLEQVRSEWHAIASTSTGWVLAYALGRGGTREDFGRIMTHLEQRAAGGYATWAEVALGHVGANDLELALQYLERTPAQSFPGSHVAAHLGNEPLFEPIRHDPRFLAVLRHLGLHDR